MAAGRDRIAEIAKRRGIPVPGCAGLTQEELDRNMAQAEADAAAEDAREPNEADAPEDDDFMFGDD
jgi:hypothetical protein